MTHNSVGKLYGQSNMTIFENVSIKMNQVEVNKSHICRMLNCETNCRLLRDILHELYGLK